MNAPSPRVPSGKAGAAVIRNDATPSWSNPRTALFVWILGAPTTLVAGPLMFRAGESLPRVVVYNSLRGGEDQETRLAGRSWPSGFWKPYR